jgi:hypothetical protein
VWPFHCISDHGSCRETRDGLGFLWDKAVLPRDMMKMNTLYSTFSSVQRSLARLRKSREAQKHVDLHALAAVCHAPLFSWCQLSTSSGRAPIPAASGGSSAKPKSRWKDNIKMDFKELRRQGNKCMHVPVISGFSRGVNEIHDLLGCYAVYNGSFLPTFRDKYRSPWRLDR